MNTPEESTKSEDLNEYTPNRLVDTISLTLAKLQKKVHLHLIYFCD